MNIKKELIKHKFFYLTLVLILFGGLFFRVYRTAEVLGFYFDQGRDALVIADFLAFGKVFLIGPTTGIAGIFRGPFYYYLISPFYWLGRGNPVFPAVFLALTTVIATAVGSYLINKIVGKIGAVVFAMLSSFSFYIILASRWLSNPTPMLLLSMLLLWSMFLVIEGKKWAWIAIAFIAGSSLFHFGSSGEFFYLPAIFIFFVWQSRILSKKRNIPSVKIILLSIIAFLLTALPLLLFDFRHDRILTNNILSFLFNKGSFKGNFWSVVGDRFNFYYSVFSSKIFETRNNREIILLLVPSAMLFCKLPVLIKNKYFVTVLILFLAPIIGLLFFQGNEGNIYDYYLTGYYLIFLFIMSVGLALLAKSTLGKTFLVLFFAVFMVTNLTLVWSRFNDNGDGENTIIFENQKQALDWIFNDAKGMPFNTDYYVPPVIPYSYSYLERWYSNGLQKPGLSSTESPLLYTLYEVDPPHPERLTAWLDRQKGIGTVVYEQKFGGITVQRRTRIKN